MRFAVRHARRRAPTRMRGLSLLELLVAFVILAFSLAAIYRASGGTVRNIATTEQHARAATLVQGLLDARDSVPASGWNEAGESAGLRWQVSSTPYDTPVRSDRSPPLQEVRIVVRWAAAGGERQLAVTTLRPQGRWPLGATR